MDIVVMKFGGTSVRDDETRYQAFNHIRREVSEGHKVIVVVSAMGRRGEYYSTDSLKELVTTQVTPKENDRLITCGEIISSIVMSDFLKQRGLKATSLSPSEVGIKTDDNYGDAKILTVETEPILSMLTHYDVLVAPGFLGTTADGNIATLGRGGSDTSAVALGGALGATYVDIYSDVEGVMTADPKLVKDVRILKEISYDNLIKLSARGAKVIHLKAVEMAKKYHVNLRLRSTTADHIGTYVVDEEKSSVSLTHQSDYTQYKIFTEQLIASDLLIKQGAYWYARTSDEEQVESYLKNNKYAFAKKGDYVRVSCLNARKDPEELTFYVEESKLEEMLNFLHYNLI